MRTAPARRLRVNSKTLDVRCALRCYASTMFAKALTVAGVSLVLAAGCSPVPRCVPGSTQACVGNGCFGAQSCEDDGTRYTPCVCSPGTDAGAVDSGSNDASIDAGEADSGTDAGIVDAGSDGGSTDAAVDSGIDVRAELARYRWSDRTASTLLRPANRTLASLVYVPELNGSVLLGGTLDLQTMFADAWLWNGTTWTPLPDPPFARAGHSAAYNFSRHELIVFGGRGNADGGTLNSDLDDTWSLSGGVWNQLPFSPIHPPSTILSGMAYSESDNGVVVAGGLRTVGAPVAAVTLLVDGGWVNRLPMAAQRYAHAVASLPSESGVVVFGGIAPGGYSSELLLVAAAGERVLAPNREDGGPSPREAPVAASVSYLAGVLVFSGFDMTVGLRSDTWFWSAATGWVELALDGGSPPPRSRAAATFDEARNCFVVFGGQGSVGDTWELCRQ